METLERTLESTLEEQVRKAVDEALARRSRKVSVLVFSGEMDKLMVAFMVATSAAAMGMEATMFFSFWGLAAIRDKSVYAGKPAIDQLLTAMLGSGAAGLPVSRMNLLGMGSRFFERVMKSKNVVSLSEMVEIAREGGVRMIACPMSMEVMGMKREELLAEIEVGGVTAYLADASRSGVTLIV